MKMSRPSPRHRVAKLSGKQQPPDRWSGSPRVFVVKPQLTLASLISPVAKVPQWWVKGEKFNPAIRKLRIGGPVGLRICRYLLIPSAGQRCTYTPAGLCGDRLTPSPPHC
jgi:hypothetical protein